MLNFFDVGFGDAYMTKGLESMARRSLSAQYLAYDYSVICDESRTSQNMRVWYFPASETIWSNTHFCVLSLSDCHNMYKTAFFSVAW